MTLFQKTLLASLFFISPALIGMELEMFSEQNEPQLELSRYAMRKNLEQAQTNALIELIQEESEAALENALDPDETSSTLESNNNRINQTYKTLITSIEKWTPYINNDNNFNVPLIKSHLVLNTGIPLIHEAYKNSTNRLCGLLRQGSSLIDCLVGMTENHKKKRALIGPLLQDKVNKDCHNNLDLTTGAALNHLYKRIKQEPACSWRLIKKGIKQELTYCHNESLQKIQPDINDYCRQVHRTIKRLKNDNSQSNDSQLDALKKLLFNSVNALPTAHELLAYGYSTEETTNELNQKLLTVIDDFYQLFQPALNKGKKTLTEIPTLLTDATTKLQPQLKRPPLALQKPRMRKSSEKFLHAQITQMRQKLNSLNDYATLNDKAVGILIDVLGPILYNLSTSCNKNKPSRSYFPEQLNDLFLAYKIKTFIAKTWDKALQDLNDKKITDSELETIIQKASQSGAQLSGKQIKSDRIKCWLITGVAECLDAPQEEQ